MLIRTAAVATVLAMATQASADGHASGDAEAGAKAFNKCKSCHMIASADETIVRGGKTGPNLYGVFGRAAGSVEGFKYSKVIVAAGGAGLEWNEADFVAYVADPTKFLQEYTGDAKGRGKMTFKLPKADEAANIWAYLVSVGPAAGDS